MSSETYHLNINSDQGDVDLEEHTLSRGTLLDNGRYEIMKEIGRGGMGYVYLARDLRFKEIKRLCAVKEIVMTSPDPTIRKMQVSTFTREANTLVSLDHPAIVKVFDKFFESNKAYLIMAYVQGRDLEDVVTELPDNEFIQEDRILRWGIQICDLLAYLHGSDTPIVYRDLKPSNLILKSDGSDNLVMIDFGIAKAFEEDGDHTMIGTEGYSPPEQYSGEASPQGDVYSLGATLHHLLTRRDPKLHPPFSFHEAPPHEQNPYVSTAAEAAIMKALNYKREERYQSANEMKAALQEALMFKTQAPRGTQMLSSAPSPAPSQNISTTVLNPPPGNAPQTAYFPQQGGPMPQSQMPQYPQIPPQQMPQYPQQMPQHPQMPQYPMPQPGQIPGDMYGPNLASDQSDVVPVWSFKCEDEIRSSPSLGQGILYIGVYDNNVYALDAKTGSFRWKYPTEGGIASTPYVYKDRVLFGSEDRSIYAVTSHTGKLLWSCPTEGKVRSSIAVAHDHAFFGSDDGRLYAVNIQSGRVVWRFEGGGPIQSTPAIEGELVYVGCEDGHLYALSLQTGKMKWRFRTNRGVISSPTIFEDLVLFGSKDRFFYALDKNSGWVIWKHTTSKEIFSSPRVADGIVYFGSVDTHVYAIDAETGRVHWKFKADAPVTSRPAVSDEAVYFGTSRGSVISVFIKNGQKRWQFISDGPVPSSPILGEGVIYIGSTDHHVYALPA